MSSENLKVRMAPSPTGKIHVGSMRTALYSYLLAKKEGGKFVLRIEDTDQKRKVEKGNEIIKESFALYDMEFDEGPGIGGDNGPYIQSERKAIYNEHAQKLVDDGNAYYCFCSPERLEEMRSKQKANNEPTMYDSCCRELDPKEVKERAEGGQSHVIRMKMPKEGETVVEDVVMGKVKFKNELIEDGVILKSDGLPTYHLAVVIDDHMMEITHVLRGVEWLPSLPKHLVLYNNFGWDLPKFAHIPLILNPDGKGKLSKRKGALSATSYLRKGYMRDVMFNYLALVGWSPNPDEANPEDIYSTEDLIKLFDLSRVHKAGGRYDEKKLDAISGKHIRALSIQELATTVLDWSKRFVLADWVSDSVVELPEWEADLKKSVGEMFDKWEGDSEYFEKALGLVHERVKYFSELPGLLGFLYTDKLEWSEDDWKLKERSKEEAAVALEGVSPKLREFLKSGGFNHDKWEDLVRSYADELGWKHGEMFMLLRSATTGTLQSPPLLESYEVIGWERVESFISQAIEWLRAN